MEGASLSLSLVAKIKNKYKTMHNKITLNNKKEVAKGSLINY